MSLFGKKAESQSKPAAPALHVPSTPPVPPAASQAAAPVGGRKRITQRLVLGGKGADSGAISSGAASGGLKLPGAPDPVTSQSVPMAAFTGSVDVPVESILGSVPAEFVVSDHETLYQSPLAKEMVNLPLSVILPLLPSGKVEILAQDLHGYMPQGVMKSGEELGEYALSPIMLPLSEVISRIPEAALTLRTDQKPIDSSVSGMDDPFSAEMLAAAQEEAAQKAQEAELAAAEANVVAEQPEVPAPSFAPPAPPAETEAEPAPVLAQAPIEPEAVAEPAILQQEPAAEGDLSFAKSPEYQEMLKKLEEEAAQEAAEAPEAAPTALVEHTPLAPEEPPSQPEQLITPTSSEEDFSDTEVTKLIPKPPRVADSLEDVEAGENPAENPLFAPTRLMAEQNAPAAIAEPAAAPEPPMPVQPPAPAPKASPAFTFQAPQPEPVETETRSAAAESAPLPGDAPVPAPGGQAFQVSGKLAQLLGIRGLESPTLKDIVHQVNAWPGMKGCIVGGKDGLRISSEVEDDEFANSISAFAPKLIATISDLFTDLGYDGVEEMHTPIRDSSVYIFRKQDLYMIVLFEDTSFPESYRARIKQVMSEIGSAK